MVSIKSLSLSFFLLLIGVSFLLSTGFFSCLKCKTSGEYGALQKLLHSCKKLPRKEVSEYKSPLNGIKPLPKELILKEALHTIPQQSDGDVKLLQQFGLPVSLIMNVFTLCLCNCMVSFSLDLWYFVLQVVGHKALEKLGVRIDHSGTQLYFPLRSIDNVVAGNCHETSSVKIYGYCVDILRGFFQDIILSPPLT